MSDAFADKFNAKSATTKKRHEETEEFMKKLKEGLAREYPRFMDDLHQRVSRLFEKVTDARIDSNRRQLFIGMGRPDALKVEVTDFTVAFMGNSISFHGSTETSGNDATIKAHTKKKVGAFAGNTSTIFVRRLSEQPEEWGLVTQSGTGKNALLTDDDLKRMLETALLG